MPFSHEIGLDGAAGGFVSVMLVCGEMKNPPCHKSAQISDGDALYAAAPYRLHRSA